MSAARTLSVRVTAQLLAEVHQNPAVLEMEGREQAGVHVGMTERLTLRLRDQAGRNLPSDEHWSGMITFRGLTPHAR